ncbi:MAG: hypothetical protein AELANPGJ_03589 [Anaerolineae bacterium]|nr:hypothetical protein [Anaerolineae bacterium]
MEERKSIIQRLLDYATGKLSREKLEDGSVFGEFKSSTSAKRYATMLANRFERENALRIEYKNSTLILEPIYRPTPDTFIPENKFISVHATIIGEDGRIFNVRVGLRTGERFSRARLNRALAASLPADVGMGAERSDYLASAIVKEKFYVGEYIKKQGK